VIGHKAYKKEKWKSSHFSFLFLQILNYKVFKIYHKKHQKARVNLKHLAGTIPSTAARWSARLPDHLPESSSFLIKRAAKSPAEKGKIEVPPKSPEGGLFSNVCRKCLSPPSYIFLPGSRSGVFSVHYTPCLQTPEDRETGRKI
jgi:hypothetical protein